MGEEWRYLHPQESYREVGVHKADSRWETCMCRSCQDKRENVSLRPEAKP